MEIIESFLSFDGVQKIIRHSSDALSCEMTFAIYEPESRRVKNPPVLWYLSGLTCSHANVMEKGEYRRVASELGMIVVCPDTSPRGNDIPDEEDNWQFGTGAGFYLDAINPPYDNNYNMYTYITKELPTVLREKCSIESDAHGIFGHSMGGHGAITIALKNPDSYKSCSALAPISQPSTASWSKSAFEKYLGKDPKLWRDYDATCLLEDGYRYPEILVDQGLSDPFLEDGLRPELLRVACENAGVNLELRLREGYDHSYYFISTFMESHLRWHHKRLC